MTSDDPRVRAAIENWAPRFVTNGVPYPDFAEVTASISSWDGWCAAWSERATVHEQLGRTALSEGRLRTAGEHLVTAAVEYHFAKYLFVDDLAQMRDTHKRAVHCHTDALSYLDPPGERVAIPYEGTTLAGVLRRPTGVSGSVPVVAMAMGLDSAKEEMGTNERPFLDRGIATLAFDGPGQGEGEYDLTIRSDYEVVVAAVLDWIEGRDDLDAQRVGLWGVSLGGYYAPRAAAFEPRVRACIALSGPYDLGAAWEGLPSLTRAAFTVRSGSSDESEARTAAARLTLDGVAGQITCPLLVVFGGRDRLFGADGARRLVDEAAGPAELWLIEDGNHVVNNRPYRYRSASADWLAARLTR